jgi:hypothetical protein
MIGKKKDEVDIMDNVDWVDVTIVDCKMGKIQKFKQWFYKGLQNKYLALLFYSIFCFIQGLL